MTIAGLLAVSPNDEAGERDHLLALADDLCDDHYLVYTQDETWTWRYDILCVIWRRRRRL